jgi:TPR repeat protein
MQLARMACLVVAACGGLAPAPSLATPLEDAHQAYFHGQFARSLLIYRQLASDGNAEAAERAGFMLAQGGDLYDRQVAQDLRQASEFLTQAAKAGRTGAAFMLNLIDRSN